MSGFGNPVELLRIQSEQQSSVLKLRQKPLSLRQFSSSTVTRHRHESTACLLSYLNGIISDLLSPINHLIMDIINTKIPFGSLGKANIDEREKKKVNIGEFKLTQSTKLLRLLKHVSFVDSLVLEDCLSRQFPVACDL
jgi:hypothetical protein